MSCRVRVSLDQYVPLPADRVFAELCDWEGHRRWVPATRVRVHSADEFTAFTGPGPFAVKDRMRVVERDLDGLSVTVEKTGPVFVGAARFTVRPYGVSGCVVTWAEDVHVSFLPKWSSAMAGSLGRRFFRRALRRMPGRVAG